jgi:biopolymer transport protein ExbD
MRRRPKHKDDQAEVNMTPMLDIVFILLIFFIVTATFLTEHGMDMRPPPPNEEDQPNEPNDVILIQVDEDENVFVNQVRTDVDRVLAAINRFRAESPGSAALIEAHYEADHGVIVQIWDEMKANGVPVSLQRAAEAEEGR